MIFPRGHSLLWLALAVPAFGAAPVPCDPQATPETRALEANLAVVAQNHILFGQQHTTAQGVGWRWEPNRSDVRTLVGDYPAVHGWDFNFIEQDPAHRTQAVREIIAAFDRGAAITLTWHVNNPVSGGPYSDHTPAVAAVLPGGARHAAFLSHLDRLAEFLRQLRDGKGRAVPVLFRPYHEQTGMTFWWGQPYCTREQYVALWRMTVTQLRDVRGVHQLLWVYSPNKKATLQTYFERYPGDAWVDVLGFDFYTKGNLADAVPFLKMTVAEAARRGKLAAFTETGPKGGVVENGTPGYFTGELLATLRNPALRGLAYVLVWHNGTAAEHWIPLPGEPLAADFKKFYADPFPLFERALPDLYRVKAQP